MPWTSKPSVVASIDCYYNLSLERFQKYGNGVRHVSILHGVEEMVGLTEERADMCNEHGEVHCQPE